MEMAGPREDKDVDKDWSYGQQSDHPEQGSLSQLPALGYIIYQP